MFRRKLLCTPRSMWKGSFGVGGFEPGFGKHGGARSRSHPSSLWIYYYCVFVFLFAGTCIVGPHGAEAVASSAPNFTECVTTTVKTNLDKFRQIACTGRGFDRVPSEGKLDGDVILLDLSSNAITSIDATDFVYYTILEELSLENNPIASIAANAFSNLTSLSILNLASTSIASLPSEIFTGTNIVNLNLSATANLDVPASLAYSQYISILDISNNQLTDLPDTIFDSMPSLSEVYASNNQIAAIGPNTFAHATITKINLSHNSITNVARNNIRSDYVLSLDLSHNLITDLSNQFLKNSAIQTLDLSNNKIGELDDKHFDDASSLVSLDLSHNEIKRIDDRTFDNTHNLNVLDLSFNLITSLARNLFQDTLALSDLNLSNNQITSIDDQAFKDLASLETINLATNLLTTLPGTIFSTTVSLTSINLSNNQLTSLVTTIFSSLTGPFSVDLTENDFVCQCVLRDYLFELYYDPNKAMLSEENVKCTSTADSNLYVFLDWDDSSCSRNLGDSCIGPSENCNVRNSECTANTCVCKDSYYDDNGVTTLRGRCKAKVRLDYPCTMDSGCITNNAECSSSNCKCKSDYYDNNPTYLGGECFLKLELGGSCSWDDMCKTTNGYCNLASGACDCVSTHYDNDTTAVAGGSCLPKISLNNSCNATYQCAPANSECTGNKCACSAGYHDFKNTGACQAPEKFFSCYQYNTKDQLEVHFSHLVYVSSPQSCAETCFKQSARYYQIFEGICLCGTNDATGTCCPNVASRATCNARTYTGNLCSYATAGINVTAVSQRTVGIASEFHASSNLSIIDTIVWKFGDGVTHSESGTTSSVWHTYTYSAQQEMTVSACYSATGVCDDVSIPVAVQVAPANLTTWITGVNIADAAESLEKTYATFTSGNNFQYYWMKNNSAGSMTRKRGCEAGWTTQRSRCVKLITTSADYTAASNLCASTYYGALLEFDYEDEIAEIVTALNPTSTASLLIGAKLTGSVYNWVSDSSKTFFRLTSTSAGDCVAINPATNVLVAVSCNTQRNYVCMKDPVDCPKGGTLQSDRYCLVLASNAGISVQTWSQANNQCQTVFGGSLATVNTAERQTAVDTLLASTTSALSEAWIGLSDSETEGYSVWAADQSPEDISVTTYQSKITENNYDCFVSTATSNWKSLECDVVRDFVCQYSENIESMSVLPELVGLPDLEITNGTNLRQLVATETFTNTTIPTEVYLFPGMMITSSTKVRYYVVRTVDLGATDSIDITLQIYRPYCSSGKTLVPPGCDGTKFSKCSSSNPTCTSLTCSTGQYPCYLGNQCKAINETCTCISETSSSGVAPAACSFDSGTPTYKVVAQTQVTMAQPGENFLKIPAGDASVQRSDVLGIQFPVGQNPIKCEDLPTNPGQQTIYSNTYTGWMMKTSEFPTGSVSLARTCYFHAVFTEGIIKNLTHNLAFSPGVGSYEVSLQIISADTKTLQVLLEDKIADVSLIYPSPDSLGKINLILDQSYDITIRVERGTNKKSEWTLDGGTPTIKSFSSSCPASIQSSVSQESCDATLYWASDPFATYSYTPTVTGTSTIQVRVYNTLNDVTTTLDIQTEEAISGTSLALSAATKTANTVEINKAVSIQTNVTTGTALSYVYFVNDVEDTSSTSSILTHSFTSVGTFAVRVNVSNIISTGTDTLSVIVKQPARFQSCQFIGAPYTAAVNISLTLEFQCTVEVGAEVKVRWGFSADASNITDTVSTTTSTTLTRAQTVTFTTTSSEVKLSASLEDPFAEETIETTITVNNPLPSAILDISSLHVRPNDTVTFTPSVPASPGEYGSVSYTLAYGDSSTDTIASGGSTSHTYSGAGNYTVTLQATNGPSTVSVTRYVAVYTEVTTCTLSYDGPKAVNTEAAFVAQITEGNLVTYSFNSSVFNAQQSTNTYIHRFSSPGDYDVTVKCYNAISFQVGSVTAIILSSTEIRLTDMTMNGAAISGCIEKGVSVQFSVQVLHYDTSALTYQWDMGDSSPTGSPTASPQQDKTYTTPGNFTITVTASYAPQSAQQQITQDICVQERISQPTINVPNPLGLPASKLLDYQITVNATSGDPMDYVWDTNATTLSTKTEAVLRIELTAEGYYNVSVTLSNAISSEWTSVVFRVVEMISGLSVTCSECITKASQTGQLYVAKDASYLFSATVATGTGVSYTMDFGDGSAPVTASENNHTFAATGTFTMIVTAQNDVTSAVVETVTINVEEPLTRLTLRTWGYDWVNNVNTNSLNKNIDIAKSAVFKAEPYPTGMITDYQWTFETGLPTVTTTSDVVNHTYTSTGSKTCLVTASNTVSNITKSLEFFVIVNISVLNVTLDSKLLSTDSQQVALNQAYNITVSSSEIVPGTETYLIRIKEAGTGSLFTSGNSASKSVTLTQETNYTTEVIVVTSLGTKTKTFTLEVIKNVSGVEITASGGNITLGSSLTLQAVVVQGSYLEYNWGYETAPTGETFPTSNTGHEATIIPGQVGTYIVTLNVSNPVSDWVSAYYTVEVMVGVSGVGIDVTLLHQDAVSVASSHVFTAVVAAGTQLQYAWNLYQVTTVIQTGTESTFSVTFQQQALYNITLVVSNDASSELAFIEIYSLNDIPSFTLDVTGATLETSIQKNVCETGQPLSFTSSIAVIDYISFNWTQDGSSLATGQTLTGHLINTPGTYIIRLDASNRISTSFSQMEIVVQDAIAGLAVSNCGGTYLMKTVISMTVTYTSGTDLTHAWSGQSISSALGATVTAYYTATGQYNVTVTSTNYVSSETTLCPFVIQGKIENLAISATEHKFVAYPINFSVTGDNLDQDVTYNWTISDGSSHTTSIPYLNYTFAAAGTYTLAVRVENAVSSETVNISVEVEELKCMKPNLKADGDLTRITERSRPVVLAVTVDNGDCTQYNVDNKWTVFTADSCNDPLTNEYTLASSILTTSSNLQLPSVSLTYGNYCVVYRSGYEGTPVAEYKSFQLIMVKSNLKALISGGHEIVKREGTELTLDASGSYDPDKVDMSLAFDWGCSPLVSSTTADAVCQAVSALTVSTTTLTGLTLTQGDVFLITVTVSAAGRTSNTANQKINIYSANAPEPKTECSSCNANGNFFISNSKSMSMIGGCSSPCSANTTYQWSVTETSTGATVTIDSAVTTTGTSSQNLVIKSGVLDFSKDYTLKLDATDGGVTGFALFSLVANTRPRFGTCTVSTQNIVPLLNYVNVTCQNWQDADPLSAIYVTIVASSSTTLDEYPLYYGTRSSNQIIVSPFGGTSSAPIDIRVYVENDFGEKAYAVSGTVQFTAPTLSGTQANYVDYISDNIKNSMVAIAKKNNPVLLLQYITAVLHFLNDQSATGQGTLADRMAIRELLVQSISGCPTGSLPYKHQKASAIKYLSMYPNELSGKTLWILAYEIETMANDLESSAQQGNNQEDYEPDSLLSAVSNLQAALQSSLSTVSSSALLAKFGEISQYQLAISSTYAIRSYASDDEMRQDMIKKSLVYSQQLVVVHLKTTLAGENAIQITMSDGSKYSGKHVMVDSAQESFSSTGLVLSIPKNIMNYTSVTDDSVYQITWFAPTNPLSFGFTSLNTRTCSSSFVALDGTAVAVNNLPSGSRVGMYMFLNGVTPYPIDASNLQNSSGYDPLAGVTYQTFQCTAGKQYSLGINQSPETGSAISVQIRLHNTGTDLVELTTTLKKNSRAYESSDADQHLRPKTINQTMMQNTQWDHTDYTYFIDSSYIGDDDAFSIEVSCSQDASVNASISYSKCQYFESSSNTWKKSGCNPTAESIPTVIHCQCDHMTSYGGSLLLSPDDIDFSDLTQINILSNPVAIITCSVVLLVYIVAVVACRRMDLLDIKRISHIPLCGKDGSFKYEVTTVTGRLPGAGTSAHVGIRLVGEYGKTGRQHISKKGAFQRTCSDTFVIAYDVNLGELNKLFVWHDNSGLSPSWYLSHVIVHDLQTLQKYYFICDSWLSLEQEKGSIQRELKVAGAKEMSRVGYRMKTATFNALADKHLWLSLLNRPARSRFTRVQRATCCVTLLFTFIGVNAMWYGLLKKENTDIGWGTFGWEEIVLAIVTNIVVFPISFGLVFLFKKSRSKANMFQHLLKPQTAESIEIENLCDNSQGGSFQSRHTGEVVPYDIERESTIDSVPMAAAALHRSRVMKSHRENTDDSFTTRPRVSMTTASAKSPLWNQDNIMKWPEAMQYNDADSRPSTSSTIGPSGRPAPGKSGMATPAPSSFKKGKTLKSKEATQQLLDELDDLEKELKESEAKSVRSSGSKRSATSSRKASLRKASWGSLEDILHSDDESSVAESGRKASLVSSGKRGSVATTTSNGKRFNPRADARINRNNTRWPKSRESVNSGQTVTFDESNTRGVASALRPGYYSEMTMESRDINHHVAVHREKCSLPPWCVYVAYTLCFLLSVFSVIIVILYCFKFGVDESTEWVLAFLLSLLLSFCVIEPLKALLIAVYVVASYKSVEQDEDEDNINIEPTFDSSNEKLKDVKFKPVSGFALLQAKEEGRKLYRMNQMLRQFLAYVCYLWLLMVVCYIHLNQDAYLLNRYVNNSFVQGTTPVTFVGYKNISSIEEFWDWSENVMADSLHLQITSTDEEHGFLLGAPRWRLIRSLTEKCMATDAAARLGASSLTNRTCYGENGFEEDTATYGDKWNESSYNKSWRHYTGTQLGGSHKVGFVDTYGGGGYTQELGTSHAETLTIIQDLKSKWFIDQRTRAIVIEFAMYSPGTDMTAMVAMLVEFPLSGGVLTSLEVQSLRLLWFQENRVDPLMVMECILFLVVVYSLIHLTLQIREKQKQFFVDVWNWYEMLTTLMTIVAIGMYIGCVVEATNTFNSYLDNPTGFTNFERVAYVHVGMRYLHAWLLFLLMYKVVKQMRFIKFMHVYEKTLSCAVGQLMGTGLIYGILLLVYAQLGYLMYGRIVAGFETYWHTISTLVVMIRGTFDFWPMLDHHPVFSHFYVYSYYAFTYGIAVALIISILTSTYRMVKSQMYYKASLEMQDYEMIDFMLKRLKLWTGIMKPKPAFRTVRFPGLPSVSSRSTSSYSSRTTSSLQSSTSLVGPEMSQVQLNSMLVRLAPTWQAVLKRFDKIEALEKEEEILVKKAEDTMKDLNLRCRINEFERQHKEILNWQKPGTSASTPDSSGKQRQSFVKRPPNRDNQSDRKAPATVTGATNRSAATPPEKAEKAPQGKRPLSDQGARGESETPSQRSSTREKMHKFLQSVKPSKPAWNK